MNISQLLTNSQPLWKDFKPSLPLNKQLTRSDGVHGTGLQINQDSSGHVLSTGGLVVVHIDPLQLEVRVSVVGSGGVNTVLIRDNFPELERESWVRQRKVSWGGG